MSLVHDESASRRAIVRDYWTRVEVTVDEWHPLSAQRIRAQHGEESNKPWLLYKGDVIDCTVWQHLHPGGRGSIARNAGGDCTSTFDMMHDNTETSKQALRKYRIGKVREGTKSAAIPSAFRSCMESQFEINARLAEYDALTGKKLQGTMLLLAQARGLARIPPESDCTDALLKLPVARDVPPASRAARPPSAALSNASSTMFSRPASAGIAKPAEQPAASPLALESSPLASALTPLRVGHYGDHRFKATVTNVAAVDSNDPTVKSITFSVDGGASAVPQDPERRCIDIYPGGHVSINVGGVSTRPYSPVRMDENTFTIVVKQYRNGVGSTFLHQLSVGSKVDCRGPLAPGFVLGTALRRTPPPGTTNTPIHFIAVGGGTGSAPILNIAAAAAEMDNVAAVSLMFCFSSAKDGMLVDDAVALCGRVRNCRLTVFYSKGSAVPPSGARNVRFESGRLTPESMTAVLTSAGIPVGLRRIGVVCGPMSLNAAVFSLLTKQLNVATGDAYMMM